MTFYQYGDYFFKQWHTPFRNHTQTVVQLKNVPKKKIKAIAVWHVKLKNESCK